MLSTDYSDASFRDWTSLLSDRRCVFYAGKLEKRLTGRPVFACLAGFHCFRIRDEYRVRASPREPALYRFCIYEAVIVGLWLALVMKGVLCFNNGQHRASNSSGRVKTRNIYLYDQFRIASLWYILNMNMLSKVSILKYPFLNLYILRNACYLFSNGIYNLNCNF